MDKDNYKNIILSQNMRLGLNAKKHRRNLNVLVVGGSGAGKTRFYAKPNLMQCNTSFIVADQKGEMLRSIAPLLIENGYDIKVFNLIEPENSDGYNPFVYIRKDEDVIKLISNLIQNTTPKNASQNDPFWEKFEIALDSALMLYLLHEAPPEEQTFEMLMFLIENAATVEDEDESGYQSPVDILFQGLEDEKPEHIAVRQYKIFKQASGKTAKSILISAAVRLAAFNLPEIAKMTSYDNFDIGTLGERKRAIFCVIPDNDNSFNYLVGMLYTQAFQALYFNADNNHGGELPIPVQLVLMVLAVMMTALTGTVFAAYPLGTINSLSDFIFSAIKAIGLILLGFGVVQIGLSLKSHDASQRANGFLTFFGGVIIAFAKDILEMIL